MTRFREAPVPPVFAVAGVRKARSVRIPAQVIRPVRRRLRPAQDLRQAPQEGPAEAAPPLDENPPETYDEHGERIHPARSETPELTHFDVEG